MGRGTPGLLRLRRPELSLVVPIYDEGETIERVALTGANDRCSHEAEFINALLGFTVQGPIMLMAEGLKRKPLADIAPLLQTMEHAVRRTHVVLSEVAQLATDAARFCNIRIGKVPAPAATGAQVTVGFVARGKPSGIEVDFFPDVTAGYPIDGLGLPTIRVRRLGAEVGGTTPTAASLEALAHSVSPGHFWIMRCCENVAAALAAATGSE